MLPINDYTTAITIGGVVLVVMLTYNWLNRGLEITDSPRVFILFQMATGLGLFTITRVYFDNAFVAVVVSSQVSHLVANYLHISKAVKAYHRDYFADRKFGLLVLLIYQLIFLLGLFAAVPVVWSQLI